MRALLLSVVSISSVVLAQPVPGTWSGYVNGWVNESRPARPAGLLLGPARQPVLTAQQQQLVVLSQLAAQQAYVTQMTMVERQKENARAQELETLAAQQRLVAQQNALIDQQQAAQAQLLAQQQQLVAQQQQLRAEQQQRDADAALAKWAEEKALVQKEFEAKEKDLAAREAQRLELARAEANKGPAEKGPDIHRWVDEEGVVHYSTRPK